MDKLSNSFSLLELDSEDANEHGPTATIAVDRCETRDSGKGVDKVLEDGTLLEKENADLQTRETTVGDYRMPLVWIDLEMTGLNIEVDRILEIACVITDGNLNKLVEGPDLVIHQSKECLDKMGEWCQEHHGESGLTERVLQSTISEQEAEKEVIEFVKRHVDISTHTALIAGNSVYMDLLFIRKYMPDLAALFSHVTVDVSSVKALCLRWYPRERKKAPQKENKHRAMDDIKESIAELKFYKEHIFKQKSKK
ncbi:Polynucleotidyl transferase [Perilla frutescens var. hirtella]|uniref:Polynucleotidyl transferase n=1 Tax=Perilla frutescens var. hirtella TaxID=608512 RepID=A0AAD4J703_PERFH|nr:Polynucleotidyl transferase [Perilla frutescens var. hirtella]